MQSKRDNTQVQDMDEASSDDEPQETNKIQPASLAPPTHDKVVIKKYDPKQAQKPAPKPTQTDEYLISPITGERIPASKVAEHMRIGLLDPRWVEQRDKHTVDKLNQDNVSSCLLGSVADHRLQISFFALSIGLCCWYCN